MSAELIQLLKRALPALRVSAGMAKSDASARERRQLVRDVEAAISSAKPKCSNPECEDGQVFEDYCATCEQAIPKPCPACGDAQ